tara:strand:+ start:1105 stop:1377 length:273 start_codon:yes stop_codon:yes gene_type:complete
LFTKPQIRLRQKLLELLREKRLITFSHEVNWRRELARMVDEEWATNSQMNKAIGKLVFLGAITCTHPHVRGVAGVTRRKHVLRFLKDVEL